MLIWHEAKCWTRTNNLSLRRRKLFAVSILKMERVARIELANKPWQGFRLPLHHTRINLARWTGLEPATLGVTGRYSDQLSYHRIKTIYHSYRNALAGIEPVHTKGNAYRTVLHHISVAYAFARFYKNTSCSPYNL